MLPSLLLSSVALLSVSADAAPAEFSLGDAAPKFEIKEFVKGEPVKQFAHGKTYVVEFWATWCGPCKESIPHLTELQKKYKDVAFIGVSIDDDFDLVKPFVEKMGDKMDYRVAIDARDGKQGRMGQSWLEASAQGGIPTAYVINGDGKVAWIGHPSELEEPLKQIVDGKWDLAAKAAEFKKMMADQKFVQQSSGRLQALLKGKDYAEALKLSDEIVQKNHDLATEIAPVRLALMVRVKSDAAKIVALAKEQTKQDGKSLESALLVLRAIVSPTEILNPDSEAAPEAPAKLDPALAKFVGEQADKIDAMLKEEMSGKEASDKPSGVKSGDDDASDTNAENGFQIADGKSLLARAYQATGNKEKAGAQIDDAVKALNATIRAARDQIKDLRDMKKALTADADDDKSSDAPRDKPASRRKVKVER